MRTEEKTIISLRKDALQQLLTLTELGAMHPLTFYEMMQCILMYEERGWEETSLQGEKFYEELAEPYKKICLIVWADGCRGIEESGQQILLHVADLGLSQILCNHREVVKNRVKILKGGSGASCCRLLYKITAVRGHVKGGGVSLHSS